VNLDQFERWYLQAGTPTVTATGSYNADVKTFTLTLKQVCICTSLIEEHPLSAILHLYATVIVLDAITGRCFQHYDCMCALSAPLSHVMLVA
jgi:hypothetical protein